MPERKPTHGPTSSKSRLCNSSARIATLRERERVAATFPEAPTTWTSWVIPIGCLDHESGINGRRDGLPPMTRREIQSWLMDMDGVLMREEHAIAGADQFIARLRERGTPFLVLTNNSIYTRRDLAARLRASGL